MKFKVGQKVRVVEWLYMPLFVKDVYLDTPSTYIGQEVIIDSIDYSESKTMCEQAYIVNFVDKSDVNIDGTLFFEPELEPIIKVGEQLLLFEL